MDEYYETWYKSAFGDVGDPIKQNLFHSIFMAGWRARETAEEQERINSQRTEMEIC